MFTLTDHFLKPKVIIESADKHTYVLILSLHTDPEGKKAEEEPK